MINIIMGNSKKNIVFRLINTERNKEYLKDKPHREFLDLSIVYNMTYHSSIGTIVSQAITNEMAESLELSEEQLFAYATVNTRRLFPPIVQNISDTVREMLTRSNFPAETKKEILRDLPPQHFEWIITNNTTVNGAIVILYENVLDELAQKLKSNLFLMPSSVHEMIALPSYLGDPKEMARDVATINKEAVSFEEQLSDHIYHYDMLTREITLIE